MNPHTLPPQIEQLLVDELVCWRVRTPQAELLVAQQGAQILSYRRTGEPPLIWLSEQAAFRRGQPVRGGVPLCWPWFGDLARNPPEVQALSPGEAPFHGLARNLDWQLADSDAQPEAVQLAFVLTPPPGLAGWPGATELRLEIRLDDRLSLRLISHNRGSAPVVLSQALHSYFAVSDIRAVRVHGLDGCPYIETLQDWQERRQEGALSIAAETDRIYLELPAHLTLLDEGWQRRLHLQTQGSRSAVVWNPWQDKAQRLSQFAGDAWQRMLCIETANVLRDVVRLDAGQSHSLQLTLWSEPG